MNFLASSVTVLGVAEVGVVLLRLSGMGMGLRVCVDLDLYLDLYVDPDPDLYFWLLREQLAL